ncbi:Rossmann-fold protein [Giardia lamblia P15]|uniref:Rossmann-fold protein n=1 Tax=Giardia intestinalis (strain P15) TaxID=658858 RepID=E1F364_GIAIA|nr:Rossmann-fold protein [Giardia lamblia P15]
MEHVMEESELQFLLQCARASQKYTRKMIDLGLCEKETKKQTDCIFIRELPIIAGWVGCGVWDAAVIMSRYFVRNPEPLSDKVILELGSGVGLTGLVAARYAKKIYLTDYSTSILENLEYNLWLNVNDLSEERLTDLFADNEEAKATYRKHNECVNKTAFVSYLDWCNPNNTEKPVTELEPDISTKLPPGNFRRRVPGGTLLGKFPMIIGSELTYQLPGVEELANIIDLFLEPGGVFWEIISIFRGPGPRKFMLLMEQKGWVVEARWPSNDLLVNLNSRQSRSRDEKYLFWTLFRLVDDSRSIPRFGDGPAIDWHALEFTSDHT